jgi:putative spermidine/putrescine transport system substrate-binding protein
VFQLSSSFRKKGSIGAGSYWHIVKGSTNKELALIFLDEEINETAQQGNCRWKLDDLYFPDYNLINKNWENWNEQWNKQIRQ